MTPFYSNRKVLVTGGAGFLGSHMVDSLLAQGAEVTVFDNLEGGTLDNLSHAIEQIRFLRADVRDREALEAAVTGQDTVFHFAANASVPRSVEDPLYDFDANAHGTFNLCCAARVQRPRRVVLASSAAVYGEPEYLPMDEKHSLEPLSPYGASKLAGERVGMAFHRTFGIGLSVVRIFNSYGPRQPRYVIHDLIRKLQRNSSRLEVLGDGSQMRDYGHVSDTVRAFLLVGELGETDGQAYNAAGGRPISISELAQLVVELWDKGPTEIVYTGRSWPGDIRRLAADITKLRALGFEPQCDLRSGIRDMIEWFLGFRPEGAPSL